VLVELHERQYSDEFLLLFCALLCILEGTQKGTGIVFSGAGGRLGQHAALMESLVKGLYPEGSSLRPSYLSGVSAGSISAVALSAILETQEKNISGGFNFEEYKQILFLLRTSDIFDNSWAGLKKDLTFNIFEGFVLDNQPLERTLTKYLKKMNYKKLKDLYIPTCISLVNKTSGQTIRLWSTDPYYGELELIDILMASTAIPVIFSPRSINDVDGKIWIDGGTGVDSIPVIPLLFNPYVDCLYIIAYSDVIVNNGISLKMKYKNLILKIRFAILLK